jgi:hypothetical protein
MVDMKRRLSFDNQQRVKEVDIGISTLFNYADLAYLA